MIDDEARIGVAVDQRRARIHVWELMIVIGEAPPAEDRGTISDPAALQATSCMNSLRLMGFTPWPRTTFIKSNTILDETSPTKLGQAPVTESPGPPPANRESQMTFFRVHAGKHAD